MDRLKTFAKYALLIIAFWIFSDFLIFVGLNANYDSITSKGSVPEQVTIDNADATMVNGRISGKITADDSDISGKYLVFDMYSKRDVLLGETYMQIDDLQSGQTQDIDLHFKLQDVYYYTAKIVDEKPTIDGDLEIELLSEDLRGALLITTIVYCLII